MFSVTFLRIFLFSKGIFAYLNYHVPRTRREILEILIKGLQRLEYRGYDSAGKHKLKHLHHTNTYFLSVFSASVFSHCQLEKMYSSNVNQAADIF